MKIKNLVDNTTSFLLKRLSELIGLALLCLSILLLVSLISYSPEDPNFIFPENTDIKNLLGAKGSYASDILFQSIGLISLLVPISFLFISMFFSLNKNHNKANITPKVIVKSGTAGPVIKKRGIKTNRKVNSSLT